MAKNRIQNYILRIRNSDERAKRRFVAIASTISMLIVVLLWVVYLNLTLPTLATPKDATQTTGQESTGSGAVAVTPVDDSFFGVITRGARVIGGNITRQFTSITESAMNEFSKLGALATKKNEMVITPNPTQFAPTTSSEPIPPTKLPE